MRFNQSLQIICITLLVLSQSSRSQQMQHLYFGDAHTKDVSFAQFSADHASIFNTIFASSPKHAAVQGASFVVTNHSTKSIIGLAFKYRIIDSSGDETPYTLKTHMYLSSNVSPLMQSGEQMLVSPDSFIAASLIKPSHGIAGTVPTEKTIAMFAAASEIYVSIDAIVFSDGEVIGPNELQLPQAMQRLKAAAGSIQKEIDEARVAGGDPRIRISRLAERPRSTGDPSAKEVSRLSSQLLNNQHFDFMCEYIKKIQSQPLFFRKDGSSL
jgi:hypothetical protein